MLESQTVRLTPNSFCFHLQVKLKLNTRHQIDFINIDGGHIHTFNPRLYTHLIQFVTGMQRMKRHTAGLDI